MVKPRVPKRQRRGHRPLARGLVALAFGTAGVAALPSPTNAQSGNTVTLEATAYKITGLQVGAGSSIPSGTVLTPVVIRTADPDQGPGPTGVYTDPIRIDAGEAVTISANGTAIATTFPGSRPVGLSTSGGNFTGTVFAIGRDSYIIPRQGTAVSGTIALTARATANRSTGGFNIVDFGPLLPAGVQPISGSVLRESLSYSTSTSIAAQSALLYDRDGLRDSNPGEEWLGTLSPFRGKEVLVTVQFRDGSFATGRGVQRTILGSYGLGSRTTLLETAALAGRSLHDVTRVVSSLATDHNLNWSDLGFSG